jgi:putative PIN family toxin of toxin-antitoxin system
MKVLIDTNVLISAAVWGGIPGEIVKYIVGDPRIEWIVSDSILREYFEVLRRPRFELPQEFLDRWQKFLEDETVLVHAEPEVEFARDPSDAPFLACAIQAGVDFLITGDRDFEQVRLIGNTKIVSAARFKSLFFDSTSEGRS